MRFLTETFPSPHIPGLSRVHSLPPWKSFSPDHEKLTIWSPDSPRLGLCYADSSPRTPYCF